MMAVGGNVPPLSLTLPREGGGNGPAACQGSSMRKGAAS